MSTNLTLLAPALEKAGSQTKLAEMLGVPQQSLWYALNRAAKIPPEIAVKIDAFTNGEVSKHVLRPDLFEAPA